ncbi:MAG: TetR/AcrR family transcriptional regulator [Saprospiraceae bacterium]|nr:TetR/AcrR family transcriptional regulator [Saprospiraceae bacterium]
MKTKDRILHTSLGLFNERGLSQVTLRTIAKEMGISQGNLNYHFKKRQDIIKALYLQLVERMDNIFRDLLAMEMGLPLIFQSNAAMIGAFLDFKFFMLDFVQIMRENQEIHQHYLQLQEIRRQQFGSIVVLLQQQGLVRAEEFEGEFSNLQKRMSIVGDFWISSSEVLDTDHSNQAVQYKNILSEFIYPYLTPKGKKEFLSIKASQ